MAAPSVYEAKHPEMISTGSDMYKSRKTITKIMVNLTFKVVYHDEMAELWHFKRFPFLFRVWDLLPCPFPQHFLVLLLYHALRTFL